MSLWPIFVAFAIWLSAAWLLAKWRGAPSTLGRFAAVDGLRGYLAVGVFIHHGAVWYFYLHTGKWKLPPSNVYTNLGQASVALFFMITGFLFWSKLLRGRTVPINWYELYLARFLRLMPLYALAVVLVMLTVGLITRFQFNDSAPALMKQAVAWGSFTILGAPDVNGVAKTSIIIAGVTWSLRYEWLFYVMLPVMAPVVQASAPRRVIVAAGIVAGCIAFQMRPQLVYLMAFGGGIIAAYAVRFSQAGALAQGYRGSLAALSALIATVTLFPTAYGVAPLILLTVSFTIIAAGNSLFGVLTWDCSRCLGEITYSIYLIHAILLFWLFRFGVGYASAATFSPLTHWFAVCCCIPVVIAASYATFRFIEAPAMRSVPAVGSWLRKRLGNDQ